MIDDIDVWRAARLMIKRHGETAWFEAAQRADAFLEQGDIDGAAIWRRILKAIEELQDTAPRGEGTPIH